MSDSILIGANRRYHIESTVSDCPEGVIYSAFSRRKSGNKIKRRYYAIVENDSAVDTFGVDSAVQQTLVSASEPMRIEETFVSNGKRYIVIAKGKPLKDKSSKIQPFLNKGYLMVILAALILILVIIKYFQ